MNDIVLHIGLHKTATRFLQRALFRNLDRERFLVNPERLMEVQRRAMRDPDDEVNARYREAAAEAIQQAGGRTLVVSDPEISGKMFANHHNYRRNLDLVRESFPGARVIYFVRDHSDWLHSAYRQSLVKGRAAPIETFLNFREGAFREPLGPRVNGVRTINALELRFLEIYRAYARAFGPESVYLFRQEDLRARPDAVHARLAEALGLSQLSQLPRRVSGNRAFSGLALKLFFPATQRPVDVSCAVISEGPIRTNRYDLDRPLRKIRTVFVRHVFDRIIYRDWDLLSPNGMRDQLEGHYREDEECLKSAARIVLESGPGVEALQAAESTPAADGSARPGR